MATTRAVVRVKRVRAVVRGSLVQVGGGGGGIDGIIIEEGGVQVAADVTTLNVTGDVTATDDGGGVVTLNVTGGGIAGVILEEGGVQVATDVTTINITGEATVTDDGGGVVTVDVTGAGNGSTGPVHTVPLASAFSTTVGTGITLTDTTAALILRATGHGASFDVQLAVQSAPSSPWVRYFRFEMNPVQKQYLYGGFAIRRSSSGAFVLWSLIHTGTALELQYSEYSSPTARASFTTGIATDATAVYFKIEDDGTNFILSASPGGEAGTYVVVHSVSRTAYLADYNQIGFAADAFNGSSPDRDCILAIQHYGSAAPTYAAGSANGVGGTTDHASLTSLGWTQSGHTGTASTVVGFDGSGAAVTRAAGTTGLALLEDATQGDARTTLGLVPGTDVQAYDAGLASLAGVDTAADLVPYTTAAATWAATTLTSYIRGLLDDVDAATARGTLSAISGWTVTVDVQSGTSGTYTAPAGAVVAIVDLWGGSGGGGGGARQDAATTCTGGASGQAGEWLRWVDSPAAINGLSWSGGAGGSGGAGRTGSTGAGIAGGAGSDSTFAGRVAGGGSSGGGGSATGASLGGGCGTTGAPTATATRTAYRTGTALVAGKAAALAVPGVGSAAATTAQRGIDATGGGGASGGHGGSMSTTAAGAGGDGGAQGSTAGGTGGANTGAAGGNGTTPSSAWLPGSAGGGGGANQTGAGGAAGTPGRGCSGAGGGAGRTGNGANGSAGADGGCCIRTICITATA
jgi:hypothetical protein